MTERQVPLREPDLLIIITGGKMAYTREDGVKVIPLACLKKLEVTAPFSLGARTLLCSPPRSGARFLGGLVVLVFLVLLVSIVLLVQLR